MGSEHDKVNEIVSKNLNCREIWDVIRICVDDLVEIHLKGRTILTIRGRVSKIGYYAICIGDTCIRLDRMISIRVVERGRYNEPKAENT